MLGHNVWAVSEFYTRTAKMPGTMSCVGLLSRALGGGISNFHNCTGNALEHTLAKEEPSFMNCVIFLLGIEGAGLSSLFFPNLPN